MLEKWKRAVVHLECAADSEHINERIRRIEEQHTLLENGNITPEQFAKEVARGSRDVRFHGTALFLAHANRRYLLTARHVVWDEITASRDLQNEELRANEWPSNTREHMLCDAKERAQSQIFPIIFRVPSLNEVLANQTHREFLMNLGAGASFTAPYTFSDPDLDLALISLDQRNSEFADGLIEQGFVPIASEDIADEPEVEGQEVFTVGFPSETALLGQIALHPASANWASADYSLPVSSFGHVSMLHEALPFFWADMSIYPGNSGGPVIANNRLVGVVSAQASLPIDDVPSIRTRIPFARIIKAKPVRQLIETQIKKDER